MYLYVYIYVPICFYPLYIYVCVYIIYTCFPDGSVVKKPHVNAGDVSSIPVSGRSPREGNGNPLLYSCLRNPMGRRTWQVAVNAVAKESGTT